MSTAPQSLSVKVGPWVALAGGVVVFIALLFADRSVLNNPAQPGTAAAPEAEGAMPPMAQGQGTPPPPQQVALPQLPPPELPAPAAQQAQQLATKLAAATTAPDSIALLKQLAQVYLQAGAAPQAAPLAAAVAQQAPSPEHFRLAAEAFRDAAQHASVRPTPESFHPFNQNAVFWYAKCVEAAPQDTALRLELALRYVDSETPMAGILTLREIVQQNPQNYKANLYLGLFSLRTNQREKAVERLRAAIAADPAQAEAYYYLGSVLMEQPATATEGRQLLQTAQQRTQDPALRRLINSQLGS